jgi:uncharacterized protein YneF (UPF0154 family)
MHLSKEEYRLLNGLEYRYEGLARAIISLCKKQNTRTLIIAKSYFSEMTGLHRDTVYKYFKELEARGIVVCRTIKRYIKSTASWITRSEIVLKLQRTSQCGTDKTVEYISSKSSNKETKEKKELSEKEVLDLLTQMENKDTKPKKKKIGSLLDTVKNRAKKTYISFNKVLRLGSPNPKFISNDKRSSLLRDNFKVSQQIVKNLSVQYGDKARDVYVNMLTFLDNIGDCQNMYVQFPALYLQKGNAVSVTLERMQLAKEEGVYIPYINDF